MDVSSIYDCVRLSLVNGELVMFKVNGQEINVTMFPDRTSQVWKLPEELFLMQTINIDWYFENEGEVMHLVQMNDLFRSKGPRIINLYIDYLPYARQDKKISNETTFALHSFVKILNMLKFDKISVLDPHSNFLKIAYGTIVTVSPEKQIRNVHSLTKTDVICYPDLGAWDRYDLEYPSLYLKKERNQLTGKIENISLGHNKLGVDAATVLIVDDICDGGRTFTEAAKLLYENGAKEVNLFVTHGIFSNGLKPLFDAKINRIFTHKGEISEVQGNIVYREY
jgi:phosphoribosylpyrophosphate synthetase